MVRSLNTIFFSRANADVGFCDADPTEFEGSTLLWPESEVGVEAVVQCPTTTGAATRVCESAGVWAAPDTTACINVPAVIGELTTMVSDKMCNGKSDVQWKITWRLCSFFLYLQKVHDFRTNLSSPQGLPHNYTVLVSSLLQAGFFQ